MKSIIFTFAAFLSLNAICIAQTPQPTPIPPAAIKAYQNSKKESTSKESTSRDRERLSRPIVNVGNMERLITAALFVKDGENGQPPIFRLNLMWRRKYPNASEAFIEEINIGKKNEIIKVYADDKFDFIKIPYDSTSITITSFDEIPTIITDDNFRIILSEDQLKRLTGSGEIKLKVGEEIFVVKMEVLKEIKEFVSKELIYYYKYPM